MDAILDPLNERQKDAVTTTDGAVLVLAGAGSGKTRVITHRFAYLLKTKNLRLQNVLAVTFTNKAAGEMKERISGLIGADTRHAWIRTFHSMGVLVLRRHPEQIGYTRDFVIYDDTDSKNLVKTIMTSFGISTETYNPWGVSEKISSLKDRLVSPDDFTKEILSEFDKVTANVYREYERLLRKNKAVDFPDLIALPIKVFSQNAALLETYRDMWKYVMVDEFQDTNHSQYKLINLIGEGHRNVCVVGDDDQSIYGWRGANVDNIYDFRDSYRAKVIPLEQNYRSTQTILTAANSIVSRIPGRMEKKLWTKRSSDDKIILAETLTDKDEAAFIVQNIDAQLAKYAYKDFAIFYRTNAQSRLFEEELLSRNIPYKIFGGQKFYERKEIKDILSYMRLIVNPFDGSAFERVINVPKRKIGDATLAKIVQKADATGMHFLDVLLLNETELDLGKNIVKMMNDLGLILKDLRQSIEPAAEGQESAVPVIPPTEFVKVLLDSIQYKSYITGFDDDGLDRWSNVEELINSIKDFETANPELGVRDYLNEVTLQASVDNLAEDSDRNYVSLMTIHNAKGLEFPVVFISGVVSGLIPHISSSFSDKELNEERRLFYVAITRAKDKLTMTFPDTRMKFGEFMECMPSPFLKDIPEELLEKVQRNYGRSVPGADQDDEERSSNPYKKNYGQRSSYKNYSKSTKGTPVTRRVRDVEIPEEEAAVPGKAVKIESVKDLAVGDTVKHKQFGIGKVNFISEKFLMVNFDKYGVQNISGNFISNLAVIK
jgi:DNA helicase II / ATP-dependent DNA helicase PcrA